MFGTTRKAGTYYRCCPANNNGDRLDRYPGHPRTAYVREDALLTALDQVIAEHIFGPDRQAHLRRGLARMPAQRKDAATRRTEALRRQIEDLAARQHRLIEELETTDAADRTYRDRIRRRFDALEAERSRKEREMDEMEQARPAERDQAEDLLDALPILEQVTITQAPEEVQRKLYDALQLQIHYERPDHARFRLVLTDDTVEAVAGDGGDRRRTPPPAPFSALTARIHDACCPQTISGRG
jgi:hypothetical protein